MTRERVDHYRSLLNMHARMDNPIIVVTVEDLRLMLDAFEFYANPERRPVRKGGITYDQRSSAADRTPGDGSR